MTEHARIELLVVDDDADTVETTAQLASGSGYAVRVARDGREALDLASQGLPDAVVTDLRMPEVDGQELLSELMRLDPHLPVILVTGYAEIPWAVDAMRTGAVDFVSKPVEWPTIDARLKTALRERALRIDPTLGSDRLREPLGLGFGPMLGASSAMKATFQVAKRAAPSRATVLIMGESGTGKGELAKCLHAQSPRRDHPFVSLHCAALTETLVESELFGHEIGSFTGARNRRIGRFEQADGGTLFIDEVAEIPGRTQTKLLRVLQDRTLMRVGGQEEIAVDVRLVAATNADLVERVESGLFREDLFYRLDVLRTTMPPLRERGDDVMLLARSFLSHLAMVSGKTITDFSEAARTKLTSHDWPGNVRELRNAVERAVVMCTSKTIGVDDLPALGWSSLNLQIPGGTMREIELQAVRTTFIATGRDTRKTAKLLDMPERTVQYRLRELGLSRPRGRPSKSEATRASFGDNGTDDVDPRR